MSEISPEYFITTLPVFLPVASPFSASQFLKEYDKEFLDVVHAKQSLLKLKHKGVISPDIASAIATANEEDSKYLLFEHLEKNATVDTLREYCEVAIAADGFPRMQAFGRKMMETLSLEGLLELWLWLVHIYTVDACVPLSYCVFSYSCTCTRLCVISTQSTQLLQFSTFIFCSIS